MDKKNWEQRWAKVKGFLGKGKNEKVQGQLDAYFNNERSQIFNMILALYAREDEVEVFKALDAMYAKHPREVEFYIPQLCTYLFHFRGADDSPFESA